MADADNRCAGHRMRRRRPVENSQATAIASRVRRAAPAPHGPRGYRRSADHRHREVRIPGEASETYPLHHRV